YYLDLTISDENLQQLWTKINNFILENQITTGESGDINNYLNYSIYDFFKNVDTQFNGKLGQYINSPNNPWSSSGKSNNISVNLNTKSLYKMTSKNLNYGEIVVSNNNNISMNYLQLEWTSNYFSWTNNQINGFSSLGLSAINSGITNIVFPRKCNSFSINAFNAKENSFNVNYLVNRKITAVDLSLTSVSIISGSGGFNGLFVNCSNITNVYLPKTLTSIGGNTFYYCTFKEIKIPNSVNTIGNWTFGGMSNLSIILPNSVTSISYYSFENTSGIVIYVQNTNMKNWLDQQSFQIKPKVIVDASKFNY
ncbi:MAG: leucine-rich repeat domain-containing protein, partial [Ureaplasma sp.]|nr:leucine-rich repeat domain-containing protein [Ureaplasma sp.]